jgi:hypothetical protein
MDLANPQNVGGLIIMFLKLTYSKVDVNKDRRLMLYYSEFSETRNSFYDHCFPVLL